MTRYLNVAEVVRLHELLIGQFGGSHGIRDRGSLDSAVAQPQSSFGGVELYATIREKAASLCFSLVINHPSVDGNKRIGHAAMEVFLMHNGFEMDAHVDNAESTILSLAAGERSREELTDWIRDHLRPLAQDP